MFVTTGAAHFVGMREELVAMVPPWLPQARLLVSITGVLEILRAAGQAPCDRSDIPLRRERTSP
ncbi:hypothetical protein [Micromonospora sp. CB01531]|uniref:hypothetical protein n=1 Tax=Micromonospora sp. CB01531 TaxID=1718947 RepID=UPI000938D048|nr:hypothetical protein [Micromonospora sp. CB01531]OKI41021.1 hypothetical protein A6A27_39465 [Micromonospora sp. CB01531]